MFFDVGAYRYCFLSCFKRISSKGKIFAFEASKLNVNFLKYHIESNNIKNIKVINKLVTSTVKKDQSFFESYEASGMNSVISINEKRITQKKKMFNLPHLTNFVRLKKFIPTF